MSSPALPLSALDVLFTNARTYNNWSDDPVTEADCRAIYDLMKMAPTSANCSPARLVFCATPEARAKLAACVSEGNRAKVLGAPVTVIIGTDAKFYDKLPELFPHADARSWFAGNADLAAETAFRNSTLQGGYLMMAARALAFDCGPMSGFDKAAVNAAFFAGSDVQANFICAIGKGTRVNLFERSPRLSFDHAARIA